MQGKDMQSRARRYTLSGADLKALVAARGFASDDAQRPVLQGVYLDGRRIVATDGHRLFLWEADGLDMEAPLLLGPASALDIPYGDQAVLQVDDQGVKLQVEGKEAVALPVMDMDYVHYEKVLPAASTGLCGVAAGDLTAGLEELAPHLEGRHPLDGAGALEYKPHVELSLSAAAQRLTLGVSKRMGYYPVAGGQEAAVPGRADWHFESSVSARVALAEGEEEFRARYHYPYLRAGLEALGVGADEEVALEFNGPLQAAQWRVAGEADRRVLLMPLRLE